MLGEGLQLTVLIQQGINAQQTLGQAGEGLCLLPGEEKPTAENALIVAVRTDEDFPRGGMKFKFLVHKKYSFCDLTIE